MSKITKTLPVSIYVDDDDPTRCDSECPYCYDSWECRKYSGMEDGSMIRAQGCIEEFGMGDSAEEPLNITPIQNALDLAASMTYNELKKCMMDALLAYYRGPLVK